MPKNKKITIKTEVVNGKISYLPVMTAPSNGSTPFVKEWKDG